MNPTGRGSAKRPTKHGTALMSAMMLMGVLGLIVILVLSYASANRQRAIRHSRAEDRERCAYAGLMYARAYFAANQANWDTWLSAPQYFNPMPLPPNSGPGATAPPWSSPQRSADISTAAAINDILTNAPAAYNTRALFIDIDGDTTLSATGDADVYVYMRDDADESAPAPQNFQHDSNQTIIVGAVCISPTMQPRLPNQAGVPTQTTDPLILEANLALIDVNGCYQGKNCGPGT
jgi:type II secretory pathway pseudopilin PulG